MTGEKLFLRYAWPCAESRLRTGKISQGDFEALEQYIRNRASSPDKSLLGKCFPNAARDLRLFANGRDRGEGIWSLSNVTKFWRHHHGHEGDCAVEIRKVVGIMGRAVATGLAKPIINLYKIPLKIGDSVTVHRNVVIEKIDLFGV